MKAPHTAPRWIRVSILLVGVVSFLCFGSMVVIAFQKVLAGRGLDTFQTFWLASSNWLAFLVFCGVGVIALAIGLMLRLREQRRWRELERAHGRRPGP